MRGKQGVNPLVGMLPGGQRLLHPLRNQPSAPSAPSEMPAAMAARGPDLSHVGGAERSGERVTHNNYHFTGITSPEKIAPRLTSVQVDQSRATWT
jgi:hypothetical protein